MIERLPISIDFDPDVLATIELDPVRQLDEEDIQDLIDVFLERQRKTEKTSDPSRREFYEGLRDVGAVMIGLLGLSGVVEGIIPFPSQLPTIANDKVKGLVALYFNILDQQKTGTISEYMKGVRIELFKSLKDFGQIRAAYRDDEIGPNTWLPANVVGTPGFRNLIRERSGNWREY